LSNPTGDEFPELNDAMLSDEELLALFRDYRDSAQIGEILLKSGPGLVAPSERPTLEQAEELLRNRGVRGIQIRYRFAESSWCDTLMSLPHGVRLIRIRQTFAEPAHIKTEP